jgi:outer membrane murein-binding lipoprotein Lpp
MLIRSRRAVMGLSTLGVGAMLLLSGCDFWPPALQAQIEQLHSEAQQAAADKALLQNQLNAANKAKEELQIRVEDLTRVNKEKSAMIANLEHTIAAARERAVKATKSSAVKPVAKSAVKKSVSSRRTSPPRSPRSGPTAPRK